MLPDKILEIDAFRNSFAGVSSLPLNHYVRDYFQPGLWSRPWGIGISADHSRMK